MPEESSRREDGLAERTLVIIPTYNERENITKIIPAVLAQDPAINVLIVDDGLGMDANALREAMRFGSEVRSSDKRLGKYGSAGFA